MLCSVIASCKKEKEYVVNPPKIAENLQIDQVINDSTLVFKWGKYPGYNFKGYFLKRKATYIKNGVVNTYEEIIDSSADINHLSFTENQMPYASNLTYNVYARHDGESIWDTAYFFGSVSYNRPNTLLSGTPSDALMDLQNKRLYLITDGKKITIVNYDSRQVVSKEMPFTIGYCALGDYNGSSELYVPVNDGSLQILDAGTLQLKDKIYVGGTVIASVAAYNQKLYVASSNTTEPPHTNTIKVYDRATKNIVSSSGNGNNGRLLPLNGTSFEFVDLTIGFSTKSLNYHKFSSGGAFISETNNYYDFNSQLDASIMRSFPDGSKFISSYYGSIYDKSLSLLGALKGGAYADFAFNSDGSVIYAANTNPQRIDVFGYPVLTVTRSYPVKARPFRIFRDGNTLVCVSIYGQYGNSAYNYIIVEKINL
ncbi:hypothetical protein [Niastella koreensis]|uniref:hypothetical protein n=1 Tax=Niastella koreensis TaxID=354356 RepID=UPI0010543FDD|nr:hypothetical protein [Niastella koreensis]